MLPDWDTFHDPAQAGKQHLNWFQLSQLTQFAGFWKTFYGKEEFSSSWCAGHRPCRLCSQCPWCHSTSAFGHTPTGGMEAGYDPRWSQGYQVQPGWAHRPGLFHSKAQTSHFLWCPAPEHKQEDKVSKSKGPSTRVGRAESMFNNLPAYLSVVPGTTVL